MKIQCTHCSSIIESKSIHDLVWCKCGKIFIDGIGEYTRIGFQSRSDYKVIEEKENENELQS